MIRDQALAVSRAAGREDRRAVGEAVPAGRAVEGAPGGDGLQAGHGEGLYRRSLYTFWKRTVPPPTMMTFDAAGRETCIVRELRTNTPLQGARTC